LQRAGIVDEAGGKRYKEMKQAYRILYRSGLPLAEALSQLAEIGNNPYVQHLHQFIQASIQGSRRGMIPGTRAGGSV
ncbi:MAG: acyl-[acyl-carrier-protein]--UDP-N-acetylglucosamine O-acyltransferase, partial [Cyanobacteria bacterium P01_C01_bin.73]